MQFEVFERKSCPTVTVPIIGLQTRGTMSMNAVAFAMLISTNANKLSSVHKPMSSGKQTAKSADGSDAIVEFLYAKDEQVVGIRLASPESMHAYPVRRQPKSASYLVTAKAFLGYHEVPVDKMRRYQAHLFDGGVLGFSLKEDEV